MTMTTDRTPDTRRRQTHGLALAACLALLVPVTAASGDPVAQTRATEASRTLHFTVRFSPFNIIDVPPPARADGDYRPGDYLTFSDTLLDRSGHRVGVEAGSGLITRISDARAQVVYSMAVRVRGRGQISAQGLSSAAPTKRLAVTGGTGRYAGADGYLVVVEHRDGSGTLDITLVH
jgi:hypothetical protein